MINASTSDCSIIDVFLKNDPYYYCTWYSHGIYNALETLVNGKSWWKSPTYDSAIWYVSNSNRWTIGSLDHISNGHGDFYAPNHFSGLTDSRNQWHFKDDSGSWKIPEHPDDIQVTCISETEAKAKLKTEGYTNAKIISVLDPLLKKVQILHTQNLKFRYSEKATKIPLCYY